MFYVFKLLFFKTMFPVIQHVFLHLICCLQLDTALSLLVIGQNLPPEILGANRAATSSICLVAASLSIIKDECKNKISLQKQN